MDALRLDPLLLEEWQLDPWGLQVAAGATATLAQTLGAVTVSAATNAPVSATESTTLGSVGLSATATAPKANASLSQTLGAVSVAAVATAPEAAALAQALGSVGVSATATTPEQASLAATLGAAGLSAVATNPVSASLAASLDAVGLTAAATQPTTPASASLTATLDSIGLFATAAELDNAALSATLGAVGVSAQATNSSPRYPNFVAAGAANNTTAGVAPFCPWPAGHQANDIGLVFCETSTAAAPALNAANGFQYLASANSSDGNTYLHVWWCRATSASMASPTFVADATRDHTHMVMYVFRDCATSGNPWDVYATGGSSSASSSGSGVALTTTVSGALVVTAITRDNDSAAAAFSGWTNAGLTGVTERGDTGTTAGDGGGIGVADGLSSSAGAVAATTCTIALAASQARFAIALKGVIANASLALTLGGVGLAATGQVPAQASESTALGQVGLAGTAVAPATGTLADVLNPIGLSSAATDLVSAAASLALAPVGLASTATDPLFAQASRTLAPIAGQASATHPGQADLSVTLGDVALHSTFTAGAVAPPIAQEPYAALRPDAGPQTAIRRTGTRLVARRAGVATTSALRRDAAPPLAARPEGGEVVACRLGNAVLSLFRPKRPPGPNPQPPVPAHAARVIGVLSPISLSASGALGAGIGPASASLAAALAPMGSAAHAAVYSALSADLIATLDPIQAQAQFITGAVPVVRSAMLDTPLGAFDLTAAGTAPSSLDGSLAATLGPVGLATLAKVQQQAVLSKALGAVGVSSMIRPPLTASFGAILGNIGFAGFASAGLPRGATTLTVAASYGDGVQDATTAIQAKIDALPSDGGTVVIPDGTFLIDTTRLNPGGVKLRSNMKLQLSAGTVLKAKTNTAPRDYVLLLQQIRNVEVTGGKIRGDRATYIPSSSTSTDEWGHGIAVYGCDSVYIHDIALTECVGDGMSVGGKSGVNTTNLHVQRVVSTYNRRQGLSLVGITGALVEDSEFAWTQGTSPECGIDIEPELTGPANSITIRNCKFHDNAKHGLLALHRSDGGPCYDITLEHNEFYHNVSRGLVVNGAQNVAARYNSIHDNQREGFSTSAPVNLVLEFQTFHNNYTAGGANAPRSFDLVGTSNQTADDIYAPSLPADSRIGLNYYR